ncbi:MAG: c-type cytochrome [Kiritimatiellae bacterium]|nr:c-type cytochrome [Kiritimatiellia bacterium]
MKRKQITICIAGILLTFISVNHAAEYLSPVALVADGTTLYVAEYSASKIAVVDAEKGKVSRTIDIPKNPTGLALSMNKKSLFITTDGPDSSVFIVDTAKGSVTTSIQLGHTTMSPVVAPDGKRLYVCNRFNNNVAVIDLEKKTVINTIPVTREPIAAVLSLDGNALFVANHLPAGAANVDRMTSVITVIDTTTLKVTHSIALPNGAIDLRSITLSPDGKHIYVPSIFARFLVPTTQIARGWINTHALNIIDAHTQKLLWTILLDDVAMGAANPWGVTTSPDGSIICVAHAATHEVSLIDTKALMAKLKPIPARSTSGLSTAEYESLPANPANSLSFLTDIRRRIKLPGIGPRGITMTDDKLAVAQFFSDDLAIVSLDSENQPIRTISLGPKQEMNQVRKGHMYFEDAALCFQQWQSCGTCHPDARSDAVNWDLLNDGIGNPKSTKSLLLSHKLPPVMISGVRAKAEVAVRSGIRYIQFAMPEEDKATAIDEYLKSLKPIPSPYLIKGKLSKAATRGKNVFENAGCSSCHSGPYKTDMEKYDVGTADGMEKGIEFDTPTLIETWRTSPYLYDGRAPTMLDVFTRFNKHDNHGDTSTLTEKQLQDLTQYVLSL